MGCLEEGSGVREAVAGGTWIFLGSLTVSLTGLVFWLVITRLAGAAGVGVASSAISAALVALTLTSAGLNLAVSREVAAHGYEALWASLVVAFAAGGLAALLTVPLVAALGYGALAPMASALAVLTAMSTAALFSLVGMERFRSYFLAVLAGSLSKLGVGVALAAVGLGAVAALAGYLAFPAAALLVALAALAVGGGAALRLSASSVKRVLLLMIGNYPYAFSNQLLSMLSVYLFAFLVGEAGATGTLYISLMIALSITAIPNALLGAALPIGVRRGSDPFAESFRIGLALSTPIVVAAAAMPEKVLALVNPEMASGGATLTLLLLSIAPLAALTAAVSRMNKEGDTRRLATLGLLRLALLLALLPPLSRSMGTVGAALAFLVSSAAATAYATRAEPGVARPLALLWPMHAAAALLGLLPFDHLALATLLAIASLGAMHATGVMGLGELAGVLRLALATVTRGAAGHRTGRGGAVGNG